MQLLDCDRLRKILDSINMNRQWANSLGIQAMTKEFELSHAVASKEAHIGMNYQTIIPEMAEHSMKISKMSGFIRTRHQDVVSLDKDVWKPPKGQVHHPLESFACVAQAKWHLDKPKQSKGGCYHSIARIFRGYWDLVTDNEDSAGGWAGSQHTGTTLLSSLAQTTMVITHPHDGCHGNPHVETLTRTRNHAYLSCRLVNRHLRGRFR